MNRRKFFKSIAALAAAPMVPKSLLVPAPAMSVFSDIRFEEAPLEYLFNGEIGRYENVRFIERDSL